MNHSTTAPAGVSALNMTAAIFLGGSCDPTTWRSNIAIPMLEKAGVSYCNPQISDYEATDTYLKANGHLHGCAGAESVAKKNAEVLLFVIDGQTRAAASCMEAVELAAAGRKLVLVIEKISDGTVIADQSITGRELKDMNRLRSYLAEAAARYNVPVAESVKDAVSMSIDILQSVTC